MKSFNPFPEKIHKIFKIFFSALALFLFFSLFSALSPFLAPLCKRSRRRRRLRGCPCRPLPFLKTLLHLLCYYIPFITKKQPTIYRFLHFLLASNFSTILPLFLPYPSKISEIPLFQMFVIMSSTPHPLPFHFDISILFPHFYSLRIHPITKEGDPLTRISFFPGARVHFPL